MDVENIRGKSGFALSHAELFHALTVWTRLCQLQGQVSLVVDHGHEPSAFYLQQEQVAVVFAGPHRKADDVIAQDVAFLGHDASVVVVTADRGLIDRCRRSAVKKTLSIVSPLTLLEDLELVLDAVPMPSPQHAEPADGDSEAEEGQVDAALAAEGTVKVLEHEIKLAAQLLEAEALLRSKSGVNNKRRGKLKAKVRTLREKLLHQQSSLPGVVNSVLQRGPRAVQGTLPPHQLSALLAKWDKVRRASQRKEKTGDRVILAEQWRRQLLADQQKDDEAADSLQPTASEQVTTTIAMAHALKYSLGQQQQQDATDIAVPISNSLRLVVVSDTHGFEQTFSVSADDGASSLPEGDVLLHLGDFAMDGSQKRQSTKDFDAWLATQPHAHKIVVRGNHDPKTWYPLESRATFVNKPTTLTIGNFVFALIPYMSGSSGAISNRLMPRRCHVVATHVPPKDLLDRCYSGRHVGSVSLRRGVERMAQKNRAPVLWLCGHIHEARGVVKHCFSGGKSKNNARQANEDEEETLVINAANANSGIASRLEYGPVVLQLTMDEPVTSRRKRPRVEIVSMDNRYEFLKNTDNQNFFADRATDQASQDTTSLSTVRGMLLAVDLGLRTGFALYNDHGRLLAYENMEYECEEDLRDGATALMRQWQDRFQSDSAEGVRSRITHVAIEGADVALRQVWSEIIDEQSGGDEKLLMLYVRPEEWRADLLSAKEKQSGDKAKEAARLIARQIVADCHGQVHEGKFPTDVAEAVLMGYHVCRRLGWMAAREPAVRRYTNGNVIVPVVAEPAANGVALATADELTGSRKESVTQAMLA